ncbi:MAG TPA: hypothetical protein VGS10_24200, partial [Terracidiphilus sp.]|nr:hypothetical protein [Terracidiphilus sp.]
SWQQCLPMYEKELATFRKRVAQLTSGAAIHQAGSGKPFPQVAFTLQPGTGEEFTVERGAQLYQTAGPQNRAPQISELDPQLSGLRGIRINPRQGGALTFTLARPAQILLGYQPNGTGKNSVLDPETEQWNLVLLNAVSAPKVPAMAVWAKPLPAGPNQLDLGKGAYVILGFIPADYHITPHINFSASSSGPANFDWLFE